MNFEPELDDVEFKIQLRNNFIKTTVKKYLLLDRLDESVYYNLDKLSPKEKENLLLIFENIESEEHSKAILEGIDFYRKCIERC